MRKQIAVLLIALLTLPQIGYAADNYWKSTSDTNPKTGSNWHLGTRATTDNLIFDGDSSVVNCTWAAQDTFASRVAKGSYTGTLNDGGQTLYCAALDSINSGGAVTMSGKIYRTGDGNMTYNCSGTSTTTAWDMYWLGTGNMNLIKAGFVADTLSVAASGKTVTYTGSSAPSFRAIYVGEGTYNQGSSRDITLLVDGALRFSNAGTFSGEKTISLSITTAGDYVFPAFTTTNNLLFNSLYTSGTGSVTLGGDLSCNGLNISKSRATKFTFQTSTYKIKAGTFVFGSTNATDTLIVNLNSGNHSFASLSSVASNTGPSVLNMSTSIDTVTGTAGWVCGSNTAVIPGTSTLVFNPATTSKFKCNNLYYNVEHVGAGATVCSSSVNATNLTMTSGRLKGIAGTQWSIAGNVNLDGSGAADTVAGPDSIVMNGASSTLHFGSTLEGITATSTKIVMNTSTAGVIDVDKAATFSGLTINGVVTHSGAATPTLEGARNPLLEITNGSTLTNNRQLIIYPTAGTTLIKQGTSTTFNGSGTLYCGVKTTAQCSLSTINYTGTGQMDLIYSTATFNYILNGNFLYGGNVAISSVTSTDNIFDANGNDMTVNGILSFGSTGATGKCITYFRSGTIKAKEIKFLTAAYTTGYSKTYMNTAKVDPNIITIGANHTIYQDTSSWTIDTTMTITSAGKQFADSLAIVASTYSVNTADAPTFGALNVVSGTFDPSGDSIYVSRFLRAASAATLTIDASTRLRIGDGCAWYMGTKTWPLTYLDGSAKLYDKGTITEIKTHGLGGDTITFPQGTDTVSITNFAAADINGGDNGLYYLISRSDVPTASRAVVKLKPATVERWTLDKVYMRLIDMQPDSLTATNSRDGGGNKWVK